jgi:hypothetical protein
VAEEQAREKEEAALRRREEEEAARRLLESGEVPDADADLAAAAILGAASMPPAAPQDAGAKQGGDESGQKTE